METQLQQTERHAIMDSINKKIKTLEETQSDFWTAKVPPFLDAILSVLIPLRDQNMLFNPEGERIQTLDSHLLLRWTDLVSLKMLYFMLKRSNETEVLDERADYSEGEASYYLPIDLTTLQSYLMQFEIDLNDEMNDFPSRHYNLHQGIANVMKELFNSYKGTSNG